MAVLRGYPIRIYRIANRPYRHHRTTSRVQVQVNHLIVKLIVIVHQTVIAIVQQIVIVLRIVRLIVHVLRVIVIVRFVLESLYVVVLLVIVEIVG